MTNFYYNKKTNILKMYSENELKYDPEKLVKVKIKDIDWNKMNFNYNIKVNKDKLVYELKSNDEIEKRKIIDEKLEKAENLNELKEIIKEII